MDQLQINNSRDNIYLAGNQFEAKYIEKTIEYLYGCDIIINIYSFEIFYDIANFFGIDNLKKDLYNNLQEGFISGRYQINQIILILIKLFHIRDFSLNEILLSIVSKNFYDLYKQLYFIDIEILEEIISRDDLNIKTEFDLILFLDEFYRINKINSSDINDLLITKIRSLTMKANEVLKSYNLSLGELTNYREIINANKTNYSMYPNIEVPRLSVIEQRLMEGNNIDNYQFGLRRPNWIETRLPNFTAIVYYDDKKLKLMTYNKVIDAEFSTFFPVRAGKLINVTESYLIDKEIDIESEFTNGICKIIKYDIIFTRLPNSFYE